MANPSIQQGTLNRALVSVSVVNNPDLNVVSGYFGVKVARITFEGEASDYLATLTGAVPSGRLFQMVTVRLYLNKSQVLAASWEQQRLSNTALGDVVVVTDSNQLQPYYFENCVLMNVDELDLTGESNDYPISIRGTYPVNGDLYN